MNKGLQSLKLELLHIGRAKLDASWDYDNVISTFSRLYLVTEGTAKIFHSYEEVDLKPGFLYLIPSFTYSRYQCDSSLEMNYFHFLEEVGDGLSIYDWKDFIYEMEVSELQIKSFERLIALHSGRRLINDDPRVYDNRKTISELIKDNDRMAASILVETQGLMQILFSRFIQNSKSNKIQMRSAIYEVLNYIKEHLHESLTVNDLAKRFNLSPDHFSKVFQQRFGMRPSKYIQTVRIERSETLLLTTNNTLAQIAEKTGWESVSYYTRIFKKVTGQTPGQFRKERLEV
mgnify:CR=1 FL=1